jgi:cysteine desulfurase/selenocysteine lyase
MRRLKAGDEIVLTAMEHHANLVPWQQLAAERGCVVKFIPMKADATLDMVAAERLIGSATKIVSVLYASNVLGTIVPVKDLATLAHKQGALCIVDAAQSAGHLALNVQTIDCDFLAFSGHKMYGPTGVGVLYGKKKLLEEMQPFLFGGDMILEVFRDRSTWNDVPWKFEAGTPNIAGVIGLGAAIEYLATLDTKALRGHESSVVAYAVQQLSKIPGVCTYGPPIDAERVGVVSFTVDGIHPHDIATVLDQEGVCVRGGHHCAMPLIRDMGLVDGTVRASFAIYNTKEDVNALVRGIEKAKRIFRV